MYFNKIINITSALMDFTIVREFAQMSHNVYYHIGSKSWINVTLNNVYDVSVSNDTVKSYLFTDDSKDTAVISFKGTSVYWVSNSQTPFDKVKNIDTDTMCALSTATNDKYNDNLFFSCCFYKESSLFKQCKCEEITSTTTCCKNCYKDTKEYELNYINMIRDVLDKSRDIIDFDKSNVYFTGHSLGGMLASVASRIYNKPAVTFETPGDKHYLNLINMNQNTQVFHFGHNADPIFTGNCGRTCSMIGYNIDTKCHTGYTCMYDAKEKLGYSESILNHRIEYIVKNVIPNWEKDFPECKLHTDCSECEQWSYE
jgi:lipase ATG15